MHKTGRRLRYALLVHSWKHAIAAFSHFPELVVCVQIRIWRVRGKIPLAADITASLLEMRMRLVQASSRMCPLGCPTLLHITQYENFLSECAQW